jgi:hypothetical protein
MTAGGDELHHPGLIDDGGLPTIKRELQNVPIGPRAVVSYGDMKLIDDGSLDAYFGDHTITMRGRIVNGWVTFAGLAPSDAVQFLSARIITAQAAKNDRQSQITLNLADAVGEELEATRLASGAYTSAALSSVVQARLAAAGLSYPADYDALAWSAWSASGKAGAYVVTGSWQEGRPLDIVGNVVNESLTWFMIDRSGKFRIEQFADVGGSPTADVDLTDTNAIFEGNKVQQFDPVFRQQTVAYAAGASTVTKTSNVSTSDPWWPSAKEGEPKDVGVDGVADATNLATDRLTLLSHEHLVSVVRADVRMMGFDLGAVVKLDFGDKNLPAITPQYHRVIGIDENPNDGETVVTLWTDLGGPGIV